MICTREIAGQVTLACSSSMECEVKDINTTEPEIETFEDNMNESIVSNSIVSLLLNCPEIIIKSLPVFKHETLNNLSALTVQNCPIRSLNARYFESLKSLTQLSITHCEVLVIPVNTFHQLVSLKILNLAGNRLLTLDAKLFDTLLELQTLNVSSNLLQYLSKELFKKISNLTSVDFSNNRLQIVMLDNATLKKSKFTHVFDGNNCLQGMNELTWKKVYDSCGKNSRDMVKQMLFDAQTDLYKAIDDVKDQCKDHSSTLHDFAQRLNLLHNSFFSMFGDMFCNHTKEIIQEQNQGMSEKQETILRHFEEEKESMKVRFQYIDLESEAMIKQADDTRIQLKDLSFNMTKLEDHVTDLKGEIKTLTLSFIIISIIFIILVIDLICGLILILLSS